MSEADIKVVSLYDEEVTYEAAKAMTQEQRLKDISEAAKLFRETNDVADEISIRSVMTIMAAERAFREGTRGATKKAHNKPDEPAFDLGGALANLPVPGGD